MRPSAPREVDGHVGDDRVLVGLFVAVLVGEDPKEDRLDVGALVRGVVPLDPGRQRRMQLVQRRTEDRLQGLGDLGLTVGRKGHRRLTHR